VTADLCRLFANLCSPHFDLCSVFFELSRLTAGLSMASQTCAGCLAA
jgi:hypothetical protein